MAKKDSKTELLLKETARRIFLKDGKMRATTQEIADSAGVNRSLLHYYFRSKDLLFDQVFQEALTRLRERLHEALDTSEPFRIKVEMLIDVFYEELTELPYLETFITLQLNQYPARFQEIFVPIPGSNERIKQFLKDIQLEMTRGVIPTMKPMQYFINIFALMAYPYVARPIYLKIFDLTDAAYNKMLPERKSIVLSLLFN